MTCLSVGILQLQNIPFEKDCKRQMTLKYIHPRSLQLLFVMRRISLPVVTMSISSIVFELLPVLKS